MYGLTVFMKSYLYVVDVATIVQLFDILYINNYASLVKKNLVTVTCGPLQTHRNYASLFGVSMKVLGEGKAEAEKILS